MHIRRLIRWRWLLIGLVVGGTLCSVWRLRDPADGLRSLSREDFEKELTRRPLRSGATFVRNVVVFPPIDGTTLVRFERLVPTSDSSGTTYVPACVVDVKSSEDMRVFLNRTIDRHPTVGYRYAWWASPWVGNSFWIGSALLLFGWLCPRAVEISKHRKASSIELKPHPATPQRIDPGAAAPDEVTEAAAPTTAPVKPLIPAAASEPLPNPIQEAKDFRGEFYPVAHPCPKTDPAP